MFRYERRAFSEAAELMRSVCRELNEYEEEMHTLCRRWDRNPDLPAPGHRLRKSLEKLEQRETSLNLMCRKLESVRKLYEDAERRILDLAEESGGSSYKGTDLSVQGAEGGGTADVYDRPHILLPGMDWAWPFLQPLRPRRYYYYPMRPRRPVYIFPPGRPTPIDSVFIRRSLHRWLSGGRGSEPVSGPCIELPHRAGEVVTLPVIPGPAGIRSEYRAARRSRIGMLFVGTDLS